jgi:NADPH-dependent 2,4-dienoyl-CoA reductase/sulfur reductase-like enzyme
MRFLIIGGSDAGISAALRAHELSPDTEITVLLEDEYPNFSICGLPFFLSGETADWRSLAHRTQFDGIRILKGQRANRVSGVFVLHTIGDSFAVREYLDAARPRRALIVGGGYITEFGALVAEELKRNGVHVSTRVDVHAISQAQNKLRVFGSNGFEQDCEIVLLAVGVKPNTRLGLEAGLKVGPQGAFLTNCRMESGLPDVYVAGDCAETWHRLLKRPTYLPLGTISHEQGRIAGENAIGGASELAVSSPRDPVQMAAQAWNTKLLI